MIAGTPSKQAAQKVKKVNGREQSHSASVIGLMRSDTHLQLLSHAFIRPSQPLPSILHGSTKMNLHRRAAIFSRREVERPRGEPCC